MFDPKCLKSRQAPWYLSHFPITKTIMRWSIRMRITRSTEHRRSENTICTAPVRDCERSENSNGCLNFWHHRYDIYRYHRNRQVGVLDDSPLRPWDISVVSRTKESVTSSRSTIQHPPHQFTLLIYMVASKAGPLFIPTRYRMLFVNAL